MNGVDWEAVRKKYDVLLPYVANRYDLTYILGEMIGELSNSHTYVGGGDQPDLHPVNEGLLGVDYRARRGHRLATASRRFIPAKTGIRKPARLSPSPASTSRKATICWRSTAARCALRSLPTNCSSTLPTKPPPSR